MSLNLDLLSQKFNKNLVSYKKIYDGFDNDIFVLLDDMENKYIFRKALRDKSTQDMIFEKQFSDHLLRNNIPVRKIICIGSETLLEFCEGTTLTPIKITPCMAFNGGKMLALFHKASKNFSSPDLPSRKVDSELLRALSMQEKIKKKHTDGANFIKLVGELLQSETLKKTDTHIIHNDFRVQNVLFQQDNISAILDFDWSCIGNPLKDLAHAMVEWSFPDGGNFNCEIFKSFFQGYKSIVPDINIEELKYWITFSCISDTATYLCDTIDETWNNGRIVSWMYGKHLFFDSQDIAKLTE